MGFGSCDYQEWLEGPVMGSGYGGWECLVADLARVLDSLVEVPVGDLVWGSVVRGPMGIFVFGLGHPIRWVLGDAGLREWGTR